MSSIGSIVRKNHAAVFWCTRHYPKKQREAVYTIYALVKHFDDLSASSLPGQEKKEILDAWNREISNIYDKRVPETDIGRRIYKNCMRFKLNREYLETILKSYSKNCPTPLYRPSQEEFQKYCEGVAEIPCYLILKIIANFSDDVSKELSENIGRAVEITNILKNIKDDMLKGHVYIPNEILLHADIKENLGLKEILTHKNLYIARTELAKIAKKSYEKAYRLLKENHNKNSKPIVYMLNLYNTYFELMEKRGWEIISPKPKLKIRNRIKLVLRTLFNNN